MVNELKPTGTSAQEFIWLHEQERVAITHRRSSTATLAAADSKSTPLWGLALSGGGIRSATFCLGVLQALAKAKISLSGEAGHAASADKPLLARFDYLSTVSGGGYTGCFYSAMFRPRHGESSSPEDKATAAYAALATDPPGRMGEPDANTAPDRPLRWLRENGRYLAPSNTGDLIYDAAITIRNLCAVHYVIGVTLLTIFLGLFLFRYGTITMGPEWLGNIASGMELATQSNCTHCHGSLWLSPWFGITAIWIALVLLPFGTAYWFDQEKSWFNIPFLTAPFVVAVGLLIAAVVALAVIDPNIAVGFKSPFGHGVGLGIVLFIAILFLALVVFVIFKLVYGATHRIFRAKITRGLSRALIVTLGLLGVAMIESAGQTLYLWVLTVESKSVTVMSLAVAVLALVSALRQFAPMLAQPGKQGWLSKLPMNVLLAAIGIPLLLMLLVAWQLVATTVFFQGRLPVGGSDGVLITGAIQDAQRHYHLALLLFCLIGTMAAGYFLGFINLSSLQTMYSARITRAYLGASNERRFNENAAAQRVTEPHVYDDFSRSAYYTNNHQGPAHIINVTINATTGSGDQLTQRDRQGIPMAITPAGVLVNGVPWQHAVDGKPHQQMGAELTIGQWIGISGAAFSTGIGRGTGLGTALVFGLANIRLGWWWDSGQPSRQYVWPMWRNQTFLDREFRAHFVGQDDSHWYLSDGGHYENTGVLELLRRRVGFIVCCDCGADPNYTYEDSANLMRLARIDFGAEFELISPEKAPVLAARAAEIGRYFAGDEDELAEKPQGKNNQCALLYRVTFASNDTNQPTECFVLMLKPRLILDAPLDLFEYQTKNPDFPQQTTFDQFFDEAQWESYRKLGAMIGSRIFPS